MVGQNLPEWQSRAHFFGIAAQLMRQILVDHARARQAFKRGGDVFKLSLEGSVFPEKKNLDLMVAGVVVTAREAKIAEQNRLRAVKRFDDSPGCTSVRSAESAC
ncbi:MAG: hypothetical protein NVS9B14_18480 [Candidatus Acidiferrum sp.]